MITIHTWPTTATINRELENSIYLDSTLKWQELIISILQSKPTLNPEKRKTGTFMN